MSQTTYNGWTNYATWRISLEWFDYNPFEYEKDIYQLSILLKDHVIEILSESGDGIVLDYALSFLDDVNWYEIAENIVEKEVEDENQ
jgi:hypothetical protein